MIRNLGPFSQQQGILPWGCPGIKSPISPFIRASWGTRWPGREVPLPRWLPSTGPAAPAGLAGPLGSPQGLKTVWMDGEDQDMEGTSECVWHELHIQGVRGVCLASCCVFCQLLFSCSVVSDSLRPHGPRPARLPCPSPSRGVCLNSCPLNRVRGKDPQLFCLDWLQAGVP